MVIKPANSPPRKRLFPFEKEKGGVGSTGSLISLAHILMLQGTPVVFVEASTTQLDIAEAYGDHHKVVVIDLRQEEAVAMLVDVIHEAPPGAAILVNVPGGRFDELHAVHEFVRFVLAEDEVDCDVTIVWTMGLDQASRVTLDAMLDASPPGRVLLNLPAWQGKPGAFANVDDQLLDRIEQTGGSVFAMPAMPAYLYDHFRKDQVAVDRMAELPGMTHGKKLVLKSWARQVAAALKGII